MVLLAPGTAGKKHSRAKGGNKCTELGKRQVLHSGDTPLQLFAGGESPIHSELFFRNSSVIYFWHPCLCHLCNMPASLSLEEPHEVSIFLVLNLRGAGHTHRQAVAASLNKAGVPPKKKTNVRGHHCCPK